MRVSMSKKAVPILESLQVRADEKRGSICTTDPKISERLFQNLSEMSVGGTLDNSELQRIHQTHMDTVRSAEEALPTRYEDPLTYAWLSILVGEVAQAALAGC